MSYGEKDWAQWVLEQPEALEILHYAYQRGINTWDTADVYSYGRSEEIVGKTLKKYNIPRERVVILSKCFFGLEKSSAESAMGIKNDGEFANRMGLSRKHILDAVEASVKRLGTYLDVLWIHRLDRETPEEEIMRALNDGIEWGWVRYTGASSMAAWEFQRLQNIAERHGWHKFVAMQNLYNLLYREEEREMIPYCQNTGVGLTPWYALASGTLVRPWNGDSTERSRNDTIRGVLLGKGEEADKIIVDRVEEIAKKAFSWHKSIAWLLSKNYVTPILGLGKTSRVDEAVEAVRVKLANEEIAYLEEPYQPKRVTGY